MVRQSDQINTIFVKIYSHIYSSLNNEGCHSKNHSTKSADYITKTYIVSIACDVDLKL